MKMDLGPTAKRQIILKLRTRLKGALATHEVQTDETTHMILLQKLCHIVEENNERRDSHWPGL